MKMIDSLNAIFDKHSVYFKKDYSDWVILETDPGAQLKKVTVTGDGKFNIIENSFYKSWCQITSDRSHFLKDSDCDSVAFFIKEQEKKVIFIDLKSSLSSTNLNKAIKQDFFTFVKMQMAFALCKDYKLDDYEIFFLMACPICDEDTMTLIKDNLSVCDMLENEDILNKCINEYIYGSNEWSCKISDLPFINPNLHSNILNKKVNFKILTTSNMFDSELTFSL